MIEREFKTNFFLSNTMLVYAERSAFHYINISIVYLKPRSPAFVLILLSIT
jgi:hypothetical protein